MRDRAATVSSADGSVARGFARRLLGVGLAAGLAAATIALALTDRLSLYIHPSSHVFAVTMAVVLLVGAAASFALPLGAEGDHEHGHDHDHRHEAQPGRRGAPRAVRSAGAVVVAAGGMAATAVTAAIVLVPPATLSVELALSRDTGSAPLFQGADAVSLAATGDTASFGVGDWASVFATATDPEAFAGDEVTLVGFVTPAAAPGGGGDFALTRLVITHCVIDAQAARVPVAAASADRRSLDTGQWVEVEGVIRDADGRLQIEARSVKPIDEPTDPYEY